jgi:hypothetical protein
MWFHGVCEHVKLVYLFICLCCRCLVFGDKIETRLFDENGEEEASFIQTAVSEEIISD